MGNEFAAGGASRMLSILFWNVAGCDKAAHYIANLARTYSIDVFLFAECPSDLAAIVDASRMLSILFWNVAGCDKAAHYIANLARTYSIDVFLFAECPSDLAAIVDGLNAENRGNYGWPHAVGTKVQPVTRLDASAFSLRHRNAGGDMSIWKVRGDALDYVLIAAVHLMSKAGGATAADQQSRAHLIADEIADIENEEECQNTLVVGDLNMNPFDPGMVIVTGFQAHMTKAMAGKPDRKLSGRSYRRFYNPMWGLLGDRTPGPPGTYYWDNSVPSNQYWHMFDQVLLRPQMMNRLRNVQILDSDGYSSLLFNGLLSKKHLSDHLPILFQMDI